MLTRCSVVVRFCASCVDGRVLGVQGDQVVVGADMLGISLTIFAFAQKKARCSFKMLIPRWGSKMLLYCFLWRCSTKYCP